MKHLIILGDGMADEPIESLGGMTPLQYANTPYMDLLARLGITGRVRSVAEGLQPGSEVANMTLLGYDPLSVYEGRGVLEAASIGLTLDDDDLVLRCNLICLDGELVKNHYAGHISTEEATQLIDLLNERLATDKVRFYAGSSYRHLLIIKGGDKRIKCMPPHDNLLRPFRELLVEPELEEAEDTASLLNDLILRSQELLRSHPVNLKRIAEGKDPANSIWPWSPGYRPAMSSMREMYGINRGAVISAVNLIRGIGIYAGLEVIDVKGATGLYDTNYEGKAHAAIEALKDNDFVFVHVEASDEASHEGDAELKVKTIENLDNRLIRLIYEEISSWELPVAIALLPDHPTPCVLRTHTSEPVPFVIYKPGRKPDSVTRFDELSVMDGQYGLIDGKEFILELLND